MPRPENPIKEAVRDMRTAFATLQDGPEHPGRLLVKRGLSPDAACRDFALAHAAVPARPRSASEPAVLYRQPEGPDLLLGLYGCERRLRGWLPGLEAGGWPSAVAKLQPIAPRPAPLDQEKWKRVALSRLPFPKITPRDAGPYVTMGFVIAGQGGADLALSAHRMLVLDDTRLGISMLASRALRALGQAAWAEGRDLPISINIGVSPAVAVASATATAHLPQRFDKLTLAGALAGQAVAVAPGLAGAACLPDSEFVLHGRLSAQTCDETIGDRPAGVTMPEFLGYDGHAGAVLQVVEVTAITQRPGAVLQATLGPGREQSAILGLGGALAQALALPPDTPLRDLRYAPAGGGMLLLYAALAPGATARCDLGALTRHLMAVMPFTKTVIYVDEDVDLTCDEDVLWALTTRCTLARAVGMIEDLAPLRMDPSQTEAWVEATGHAPARCWIDATVPPGLENAAQRSF
ncbi:UbiD family decarboxylase [Thalassococcus sp. CAU 1522]|uniref:UbiD family decarboxylase n=1 Tax=Thalassococcus arenae TaxID=2851652 RepID=A0ABS6N2B1_9RHOB|nr:UbiD family decarboxylase [Thalassococcus arenae]MBV2358159.1 UbiD family decarboxylase [Thalassococcus arenae]